MRQLGINAHNTSLYNPPCNLAERQMSHLGDYLQTVIYDQEKGHNQWYAILPDIEKALNEVKHGTTLEVPSEALTGEPLKDEIALLLGLPLRKVDCAKIKEEIAEGLDKANNCTIMQDIKQRIYIGDHVQITTRHFSNKQRKIMGSSYQNSPESSRFQRSHWKRDSNFRAWMIHHSSPIRID